MMYTVTMIDNYTNETTTEEMNATAYNNFMVNNNMCGDYTVLSVEKHEVKKSLLSRLFA